MQDRYHLNYQDYVSLVVSSVHTAYYFVFKFILLYGRTTSCLAPWDNGNIDVTSERISLDDELCMRTIF